MNDVRGASCEKGFDLGSGHRFRWQNPRHIDSTQPGKLDIGWKHPCADYIPADFWSQVDVSTGTRHVIVAGGPGDEEHLTIQGSLLCLNCKTHGFIENGKWRQA